MNVAVELMKSMNWEEREQKVGVTGYKSPSLVLGDQKGADF